MLRGAIIGFGKIARTGHLPAYRDEKIRREIDIVAVAEPDPNYRQAANETITGLGLYDTVDDLLSSDKVDFVDICTPPSFHADIVAKCARKSVHILCEKPFVLSVDEAKAAAGILAARQDLVFMCCHQYRYSPIWREFKAFIDQTADGIQHLLQFNIYRTGADTGLFLQNPNWRTDPWHGGGILADTGVHYLYLTSWMLGQPRSIWAGTYNIRQEKISAEDTAIVNIECEKGVAQIVLTWGADRRANSARITNMAGNISYDGSQLQKTMASGREQIPVPDASDKRTYIDLYISLLQDFISQIKKGSSRRAWIRDAYQSVEMTAACHQSARTCRKVELDSNQLRDATD